MEEYFDFDAASSDHCDPETSSDVGGISPGPFSGVAYVPSSLKQYFETPEPSSSCSSTNSGMSGQSAPTYPSIASTIAPSQILVSRSSVPPLSSDHASRSEGRGHRVEKPQKNKRGRESRLCCSFPGCSVTATRKADIVRHAVKHDQPSLPQIYAEASERHRLWCQGCFAVLSRADSRRRHEESCYHYTKFTRDGQRDPIFPPLDEIYTQRNPA